MTDLSRGLSHYKDGAGIKRDISLSNLRKTYLTWHHQVLGDDTGLVSSHFYVFTIPKTIEFSRIQGVFSACSAVVKLSLVFFIYCFILTLIIKNFI